MSRRYYLYLFAHFEIFCYNLYKIIHGDVPSKWIASGHDSFTEYAHYHSITDTK